MADFITDYYTTIKAFHLISLISWMAAMLYLPRLFVYHAEQTAGGEASELLKVMEYRLYRYIMTPAMIATFVFGGMMLMIPGMMAMGWLHIKLLMVLFLAGFHGKCSRWRKDFAADRNTKTSRYFRIANEVPTLVMVVIVLLAVIKPF